MNGAVQTRIFQTSHSSQNCDHEVSTNIERLKEDIRQMRIRRSNRKESDKMQKDQQKQPIKLPFCSDKHEKISIQRHCTGSNSTILALESELRASKSQLLGLNLQLKRQTRDMKKLQKENNELKQHLVECMTLLTEVACTHNITLTYPLNGSEGRSTIEQKQLKLNAQKHARRELITLEAKDEAPAAFCTIESLLEELDGPSLKQLDGVSSSRSVVSDVATQGSQCSFSEKQANVEEAKIRKQQEEQKNCSDSQTKTQSDESLLALSHHGSTTGSDEQQFNLIHPKRVTAKGIDAPVISTKQTQEKEGLVSNILLKNDIEYSPKDVTKSSSLLPDLSKSFQDLSSGSLLLFESSFDWSK